MKKWCLALLLGVPSFVWAQEPSLQTSENAWGETAEVSTENVSRGLASVTMSFVPQSQIPDEGLLVVQTHFYLPDRKHTSDRKAFSLNQQVED